MSTHLLAADRYWIAGSASNWNSTANWSISSGGSGGASVPGSGDVVYFNNNGLGNCNLDISPTIGGLNISAYTGTIDLLNRNLTITATVDVNFGSGRITSSTGTTAILKITTSATAYFSGTNLGTSLTQAPQIQCVAADLFLRGGVYYSVASFEKNGSGLDYTLTGGNTFNGTTTIINSGSQVLSVGYTNPDTFNGDVTFTNTGSSYIGVANKTSGNVFNGNIIVNNTNTGTGTGIKFDEYTGSSSILASGKTITVGSSGYSGGALWLQRFTQAGSTAQSLTLTGTTILYLGPSSTFNGNINFKSPQVYLLGAVYNGTAYIEKTGANNNYANTGGNTFNGVTTLVNSGSGPFITGYSNPDTFNGDLTVNNTGISSIGLSEGTTGNLFNGNVVVNSSSGSGINFDNNGGSGSTLASGKTLSVGTGFTNGTLNLPRFVQAGGTAQTLALTGTATLAIGPASTFNASLTYSAPQLTMQTSTFNGAVGMTNTGTSNATSYGGNTFNSTGSFTQTGTANWTLANNVGDTYNAAATFAQTSSGAIRPAYFSTNNFYGNITVNSSTAVKFGGGTGVVQLVGSSVQTISSASSIPTIQNLVVNNSSGVTLNHSVSIGNTAVLTSGIVTMASGKTLGFLSGSSVSGVSNSSYVDGQVSKAGNTAFTFPVGNGGFYAPISISAPGNNSDVYTAQYLNQDPGTVGNRSLHDATIDHISAMEYWTLVQNTGSSAVSVTLSWDAARSGPVDMLGQLTVARWNGSSLWKDHGNGGAMGTTSSGTIVTQSATSSFGPFTLASTSTMNTLPVEWLSFTAVREMRDGASGVSLAWAIAASASGIQYFAIERKAADDASAVWLEIGRVNGYGFVDAGPLSGAALYRIRLVGLDGSASYSKTVQVAGVDSDMRLRVWTDASRSGMHGWIGGMDGQRVRVVVRDLGGRLIGGGSVLVNGNFFLVPTAPLATGLYFVTVIKGEGVSLTEKVLVR